MAPPIDPHMPKRKPKLFRIYKSDKPNEHKVYLEEWTRRCDAIERKVLRKEARNSSAKSDLYQILGLFSVFQGVVLTAVAQANLLTCHNWFLPFLLSLLTSIATFLACVQKLHEITSSRAELHLEQAHYKALQHSVEELKDMGFDFDVCERQPELPRGYQEAETTGSVCIEVRSAIRSFCTVWIFGYAGVVLTILIFFSALTLLSVYRILCHPGSPTACSRPAPAS